MKNNSISLYIHVPFCRKKCDYCDFFSLGKNNCADFYTLQENLSTSLAKEVHFYAHHYNVSQWKSVYVGGGTPSQLPLHQISALFSSVFNAAPPASDAEITIEVNPDDVSEELLDTLKNAGVNRISMGIQAFDQKALQGVSRAASAEAALRALELLNAKWKGRLSCDLIAGLPFQTYASFEKGIRTLCSYKAVDHISLYTLTVEEGSPLCKKIEEGIIPWSQEKADRMWIRGRNLLEKYGFNQYEVSNFSKPGCQSRHNTVYWKLQDYIGCGPGASGTVYGKRTEGGVTEKGIRWTNSRDVVGWNAFWKRYDSQTVADNDEMALPRDVEELDADTQEFEFLMMGFRMLEGVSQKEFADRFGKNLSERLGEKDGIFYEWKKKRLAVKKDGCFSLNCRGILLLNPFLESLV